MDHEPEDDIDQKKMELQSINQMEIEYSQDPVERQLFKKNLDNLYNDVQDDFIFQDVGTQRK